MRRRTRSFWITGLALVALLAVGLPGPAAAEEAQPVPSSMASLGDSITRGFNACGWFYDCTSRSWSTGANDGVHSHYERLQAVDPNMTGRSNLARTGAKVAALPTQAQAAVDRGVGYVTVLMGANDACTSSEATMTSVADFEVAVTAAFDTLASATDAPLVMVSSIPDVHRLWAVGKDSSSARAAWSSYGICQSMLANPRSTDDADVQRRARVRQRVMDYNAVYERVCAAHSFCRYDGGAVFGYPFERSHLSSWDYFHPNTSGQNVLAEVTWANGFEWATPRKGNGGGKGGGKNK